MSILILRSSAVQGGGGGDSFSHGDSVTITGTGLGSMPNFAFASQILESATVGQVPSSPTNGDGPQGPGWNWQRFAQDGLVATDAERGKCWRHNNTSGSAGAEASFEYRLPSDLGTSDKFMMKCYGKYLMTVGGGGANDQMKAYRLCNGVTDIQDNDHTTYITHNIGINCNPVPSAQQLWYADNPWLELDNVWRRTDLKIITPTGTDTFDGQMFVRVGDDSEVPDYQDLESGGYDLQTELNLYNTSDRFRGIIWQNWSNYGTSDFWIDDPYIGWGGFRCVELWPTNDPATSPLAQREIQEPLEWSNTEVTIRLNRGGRTNGTYYLVVLDDSETDTILAYRQITLTS